MPTNRFGRVYLPPVMDLAQSKHKILTNASTAAQEVMNLAGAIYPFTVTDNAARRSYSVLKAFLLFCHASARSGKLEQ
jgi:hypothetical protein